MRAGSWWRWVLGATLAACSSGGVQRTSGGIQAPVSTLAFPATWVGFPSHLPLELVNSSLQGRLVTVNVTAPFSAPASLTVPAAGTTNLEVEFAPEAAGAAAGILTLATPNGSFSVQLSGTGLVPPICLPSDDCHSSLFEADAGGCVTAALVDGTTCGAGELCLTGGTCQRGLCVGGSVDCDDHNVCTIDSCDPTTGCVHTDTSSRCPAAGEICQTATCDPVSGCGIGPADDGTPCGTFSCTTSQVCLVGSCVSAPTPQGAPCSPDYPCQSHGSCNNGTCEVPDAGILAPIWTYSPPPGYALTFEGLVDADNNVYWVECNSSSCQVASATENGYSRYNTGPIVNGDAGGAPIAPGWLALGANLLVYVGAQRDVVTMVQETGFVGSTEDLAVALELPLDDGGIVSPLLGAPVILPAYTGDGGGFDGGIVVVPVNGLSPDGVYLDAGSVLAEVVEEGYEYLSGGPWPAPILSTLASANGTLYVATRDLVAPVQAGPAEGAEETGLIDLRAIDGDWIYAAVDGGTLAISMTGGGTHSLGLVSAPLGADGIAVEASGGFVLGYSATDGGVVPSLRGFDPVAAELTWLQVLEPGISVTSPLLTSRQTAVVMGAVDGGPEPWLVEVTTQGEVPYLCSLPVGSPTSLQSAALGSEVLFAQASWPDGGTELEAFHMTGVFPSIAGWTGPRGNSLLTGCELDP